MSTRTDIHSPANFDPAAYDVVGCFYIGPEPFPQGPYEREVFKALAESNYQQGNFAKKSTCDHCGAAFHYGVAFRHRDGDVIAVGEICANGAFGHDSRRAYEANKLRNRVKAFRERRKMSEQVAAFLKAHPGLEIALETKHEISEDLQKKLIKYGSLSEKQVAFAFRLQEQVRNRARNEERRKAEMAAAPDWTEGRQEIEGTVLSAKYRDTPYGMTMKLVVKLDDGRRCWGTAPASIDHVDDEKGIRSYRTEQDYRGLRVRFTASFKKAEDDPKFAFYKRPTKAEVVSEKEGVAA